MIFLDIPHVALRPMRRAKAIDNLAASTQVPTPPSPSPSPG